MRQHSTKERRLQLEEIVRMYKHEFELLLKNGRDKQDIKLFVNKYVRPVIDYKPTTYYYDIYFALRRCYMRLFKTDNTMENSFEKALNQPSPTNDQIIAALPFSAAIDRLKMALIENQDLREAWQSNIAVAFYDAAAKYTIENCMHWDESDARVTTEIANTAAINFLNNLCNISTSADSKKG